MKKIWNQVISNELFLDFAIPSMLVSYLWKDVIHSSKDQQTLNKKQGLGILNMYDHKSTKNNQYGKSKSTQPWAIAKTNCFVAHKICYTRTKMTITKMDKRFKRRIEDLQLGLLKQKPKRRYFFSICTSKPKTIHQRLM